MNKLNVTVNGTVYEVILESANAGDATAAAPAPTAQPSAPAGDNVVNSPLAGSVISFDVEVGQNVSAGDKLVTLEAMKMNTYVTAEKGGKVTAILAKVGEHVAEGQPLVRLG